MGEAICQTMHEQPVIFALLRAGLPLQQGLLQYFDKADAAFIAGYRKHHADGSFEIAQYYFTSPELDGKTIIIADTMLATGSSLELAINTILHDAKPAVIHVVCAIASTIGVDYLNRKLPTVNIWAGTIDDELTAKGYIVPGLGDAGDLCYGIKTQQ